MSAVIEIVDGGSFRHYGKNSDTYIWSVSFALKHRRFSKTYVQCAANSSLCACDSD